MLDEDDNVEAFDSRIAVAFGKPVFRHGRQIEFDRLVKDDINDVVGNYPQ